jgi:hypothetical protein
LKTCTKCLIAKPANNQFFYSEKKKNGDLFRNWCIVCFRDYGQKNKQKVAEKSKMWIAKNKERAALNRRLWKQKNADLNRFYSLNRIASKKNRTMKWDKELTDLVMKEAHHLAKLREAVTGFKWHVDHVIPMNGKSVSGLHVWNNIQVIPASANVQKHNSYEVF